MLAPPTAKGLKSAFVDISQDTLTVGDISETCSLTGLEEVSLTLKPLLQTQTPLEQTFPFLHHLHPVLRLPKGPLCCLKMLTG